MQNSFYEATVIQIFNPHKYPTKTDNYRPIFLINIDTNIFNKTKAKLQNTSEDNLSWSCRLHSIDSGMFPHMKICQYDPAYEQTKRKDILISLDASKGFNKIQHPFMIKSLKDKGYKWHT